MKQNENSNQKNRKKRIFFTGTCLVCVLLFIGCGKKDWAVLEIPVEESLVTEATLPEEMTGEEPVEETEPEEPEPSSEPEPEPVIRMSNEARKAVLLENGAAANVEERVIEIPGLREEYYFLYLSDMHIAIANEEIGERDRGTVQRRLEGFTRDGSTSGQVFGKITESVEDMDLDGVLLGGDIMDFLSEANSRCLKEGLGKLTVPYLYVTADHDLRTWWTAHSEEERDMLREELPYEPVQVLDYGEFLVLGISDSTSQLTESMLQEIRQAFALGKPVILVQHVPLDFGEDEPLKEYSRENWDGRVLLWGDDGNYRADDVTQEYLDLLQDSGCPVVAVLAGHLHFRHEGMLNDRIRQYLFYPAYSGEVALFTIKGTE